MKVPFFRPVLDEAEINEVVDTLRSGWLTTGPRVARFESAFAAAVGAEHAVAVNSGTAALHLAVESLGLSESEAVLVPAMTFAATAEVVRYEGATPVLVDCDPVTLNMDLADAADKIDRLRAGRLPPAIDPSLALVGMIPVHVGGLMMSPRETGAFAAEHGLWSVDDAAHAFPAGWRSGPGEPWQRCGQDTARVSCFSFYANKTITTGEGGMAVTSDAELAARMRSMSLHGLSRDAWKRYREGGSWDYRIVAPGFKYNLTDIAAAIGIHQLERAEQMRERREAIAMHFREELSDVSELELPPVVPDHLHAWHLFPIRLVLDRLDIDRDRFIVELTDKGVGSSVHWRPLHLHPYYQETYGYQPGDLPNATSVWRRIVTLPLFPAMTESEIGYVIDTVKGLCRSHRSK